MLTVTVDALHRAKLHVDNVGVHLATLVNKVITTYHESDDKKFVFMCKELAKKVEGIEVDPWEGTEVMSDEGVDGESEAHYDDFGDYELSDLSRDATSEEDDEIDNADDQDKQNLRHRW